MIIKIIRIGDDVMERWAEKLESGDAVKIARVAEVIRHMVKLANGGKGVV